MRPRLGVNIDHVATLRQARGEDYPSIVKAATTCLASGADQITIHLREDRRHIQDTDVEAVQLVTQQFKKPLNLEIGCNDEIVEIAIATAPDWVCLVPENRRERTTEGGLDLLSEPNFKKVEQVIGKMRKEIPQTRISLFVEKDLKVLNKAIDLKADAVEIHTGDYAMAYLRGDDFSTYLEDYKKAFELIHQSGLGFHAGHGLTAQSVSPLLIEGLFSEYNIGHWIICQSIFEGLDSVVKSLVKQFESP